MARKSKFEGTCPHCGNEYTYVDAHIKHFHPEFWPARLEKHRAGRRAVRKRQEHLEQVRRLLAKRDARVAEIKRRGFDEQFARIIAPELFANDAGPEEIAAREMIMRRAREIRAEHCP